MESVALETRPYFKNKAYYWYSVRDVILVFRYGVVNLRSRSGVVLVFRSCVVLHGYSVQERCGELQVQERCGSCVQEWCGSSWL